MAAYVCVTLALRRLRQEDCEFDTGCIVILSLKRGKYRTTKILHNFILKWEKGLNKHSSKHDVQMANVLMKIHGISLVTKNANENHSKISPLIH